MKVIKRDQPKQSRRTNALARFSILSETQYAKGRPYTTMAEPYQKYKARKEQELASLKASLGVQ